MLRKIYYSALFPVMKIISGLNNIHQIPKGTISTIGIFDGIHRGHLAVFNKIKLQAKIFKTCSLVITFRPRISGMARSRHKRRLLISLRHRLLLMERLGIDYCLLIDFDRKFAQTSARKFTEEVLFKGLNIRGVYIGNDFRFGREQQGDVVFLKNSARKLGISVGGLLPVKYRGKIISSSWIRLEIKRGNLGLAKKLLGRPFSIYGYVVKGKHRGKGLGFPTANLNIEHEIIPPPGVYIVRVLLGNFFYKGLLNIGHRPTFLKRVKPHSPLIIEVYLLDFKGSLYGKFLEVEFLKRLRPEKKFKKIPCLISAMKNDESSARRFSF